ncbi:hypothetical protein ABIA32_004298 [Streptacidiphilus sp. MAP12-20]|uniref:peptidoglycan-binding protein n=1 Tax=Streptacidiphilus sp. MAP12-20 TaxID=3156299 RepID=UPI003516A303
MAFPPHDGSDGSGHRDRSDDDTTVLPPIDADPALVRPYVHAAEPELESELEPDPRSGTGLPLPVPMAAPSLPVPVRPVGSPLPVPAPRAAADDAEATSLLPALLPVPVAESAPLPVPAGAAAGTGGRADTRRTAQRRGKPLALVGGALALVAAGTVLALLTQSSGSPSAAAQPTDPGVAAPVTSAASPSARVSPAKATPSHSPKATTAKPSPHPSASPTRHTASASPSGQPTSSASSGGGSGTLQVGSTGPAVVTLQQNLRALWIDRGLKASGTYDDRTASDVTTFQIWYNVQGDPSGVYGPNSQAKMAEVLARGNGGGNG